MWRRPFFLSSLLLVLLLDLARSVHTHRQAESPRRDATAEVTAPTVRGADAYSKHCSSCHGSDGHADGTIATSLRPRPRDLSGGVFKVKSTPGATPPTEEDVRRTILHGLPGSSMPAFADLLTPSEVDDLIDYVRRLGPHAAWSPAEAALVVPTGEGSAAHGAHLYTELGCPACHGKEGKGDGPSAAALKDTWKQPIAPRDLTAPWTFRGGNEPGAIYRRIALGMSGTPMAGYLESASPQDLIDVVSFLKTRAREFPSELSDVDKANLPADSLRRGEYLVGSGMCGMCHSARGMPALAGGARLEAGAHGIYFASNLTPEDESGIGNRRVEEIALAIQSGHTRRGRLNFAVMPWYIYGSFDPTDALAMATYLKSLPAVRNFIPQPRHFGVVETVVRKLGYAWPAALPWSTTIDSANHGTNEGPTKRAEYLSDALIYLQILFLLIAFVSLFRVPESATDGGTRSAAVLVASLVCTIVLATSGLAIYWYPALNAVASRPLVQAFADSVTLPAAAEFSPQKTAWLERGRRIFLTASCAYCHNGKGSGGAKFSSRHSGSVWATNLTPHETGVGGLSDDTIRRALRSGVASDGHAIDPDVMPWPSYSRFTDEDMNALVAFVRSLPKVDRTIPPRVPPSEEDCVSMTWWISLENRQPGCR